jgi:hypothetical protein
MYRQLLMPLAEEGWFREEETFLIIKKYLLRAPGAGLN